MCVVVSPIVAHKDTPNDCSLRGAISIVNNNPTQHYAILVPNNTYGLITELQVRGNVTIIGLDAYDNEASAGAIITRDGDIERPLFSIWYYIDNEINRPSNIKIYNLTFRDSNTFIGGGLEIHSSNVGIYNSRFENNYASYGGAISANKAVTDFASSVEIINTIFNENSAIVGGAIVGDSGNNSISVECSTFEDNYATQGGGAIFADWDNLGFSGQITIINSNFIRNSVLASALYGGGAIYRTSGNMSLNGNYWNSENPPSTVLNATNSVIHSVGWVPIATTPFALNCDTPELPIEIVTVNCLDINATPQDCINELALYGIIAYADGLPTSHPNACATWTLNDGTTVYNQPWTLEELQQVMVGVKNTAKAFYMLKNNLFASSPEAQSLTGDSAEEKQIFRTVMDAVPTSEPCNGQIVDVDGFYILRVQNNFKYNNASEYCDRGTADKACTSNSNHAIAFYEGFYPLGLDFIQYTFVHELGHRFDNQSGISSDNLTTRGSQTITDCSSAVVMGYIPSNTESRNDWLRGNRGWGDINTFSNIPTYFQQNTLSITFPGPESRGDDGVERKENQTPEISEAMADMFLNWVHRRITDKVVVLQIQRDATTQTSTVVTDECAPLNIPDVTWANVEQNVDFSWDGFRNIQIPVNNNNHDSRLPGNARYWWMTASMDDIFRDSNWSGNE